MEGKEAQQILDKGNRRKRVWPSCRFGNKFMDNASSPHVHIQEARRKEVEQKSKAAVPMHLESPTSNSDIGSYLPFIFDILSMHFALHTVY